MSARRPNTAQLEFEVEDYNYLINSSPIGEMGLTKEKPLRIRNYLEKLPHWMLKLIQDAWRWNYSKFFIF
jgi:hypothetical protein